MKTRNCLKPTKRSQVIVEKFGMFARFGFMHLVATNLSLWIRTVIWESANEWIHHIHR